MSYTLVQFDFPFTGLWGDEMVAARGDLARDIAQEDGLVWKIWTENPEEGRAGGIYVFETPEAAVAYRDKHSARLAEFGITGINAQMFDVNEGLSALTRAPI
ncbi:MAG TPA: monooxygenase [Rhodobacteraceae bacterium]|jgi:hypothetical protein|nr:monooxygenase [Paracoccaceae bacterium]